MALSQSEAASRHLMLGDIALAERRFADAVREYRDADRGACRGCALPDLARAYDLAGSPDSALAVFTRYLETPDLTPERTAADAAYRAGTLKRLGELYEANGDRARATSYYTQFIELWKDADPELQPKVAEVRRRLAVLGRSEAGVVR